MTAYINARQGYSNTRFRRMSDPNTIFPPMLNTSLSPHTTLIRRTSGRTAETFYTVIFQLFGSAGHLLLTVSKFHAARYASYTDLQI